MHSKIIKFLTSSFPGGIDILIGLLAISFGGIVYLIHQNNTMRAHSRLSALRADSLEAIADSTRNINGVLSSDLNLVTRRAVQAELRSDSLDKKLKVTSKHVGNLTMRIDSISAAAVAHVTSDSMDEVRSANFHVRKQPHTIDAHVELPRAPQVGKLDVSVKTDVARVQVRAVCGDKKNGVRQASITVQTPEWLIVNVDSVQQDPDVCNEPINKLKMSTSSKIKIAASFLVALLLGKAF